MDESELVLRLLRDEAERILDRDGYFTDEYHEGSRYELEHEPELDLDVQRWGHEQEET